MQYTINNFPTNLNKIGEGHNTSCNFFYKEGGVKYYVDFVSVNSDGVVTSFHTRNSNTGKTNVVLRSEIEGGKFSGTYFFSN
jgi:hypothetical protein